MPGSLDVSIVLRLVDQVSGPAKKLAQNLRDVQRGAESISGMSARLAAAGGRISRLGRAMTLAAAPVATGMAAAGVTAFKGATQFQDSMDKIVGLVGVARQQVESWRKPMEQIALRTTKPMQDLGDAMFFVTSAGLRGKAALETLERSATASAAGLGETQTIADVLTSALNTYGTANLSAAKAADILAASVREGKADAASLAPAMKDVIPTAQLLGVRFDEVGAALAAMTRLTGDASKASTGLQGVLFKLLSPSEQAKKQAKELGFTFDQVRAILQKRGLLAALTFMHDKVGDNGDAMRKLFEDREAVKGFLQLVGTNAKENAAIFERMGDATGALDKAFKAADKGGTRAWAKTMAALNVSMVRLGTTITPIIVPALNKIADALQSATKWFTGLSDAGRKWTIAAAGLAVGIGPVTWAIGGMAKGLANVVGAFKALNAASLGAALFSPLTLALTGLAVAIYAVYKNWDKVKPAWEAVNKSARDLAAQLTPIKTALREISDSLGIDFSGLFDGWDEGIAGGVAKTLKTIATGLERINGAINALKSGDLFAAVKNAFGAFGSLNSLSPINMLGRALGVDELARDAGKSLSSGPSVPVVPRGIAAAAAAGRRTTELKKDLSNLIGSDLPATAAANAPVVGATPPGITIEANGPKVTFNQAPPNVSITVNQTITEAAAAPGAAAEAVGRAIASKVQAGMYDGTNEH